jgi:hypothetical protein
LDHNWHLSKHLNQRDGERHASGPDTQLVNTLIDDSSADAAVWLAPSSSLPTRRQANSASSDSCLTANGPSFTLTNPCALFSSLSLHDDRGNADRTPLHSTADSSNSRFTQPLLPNSCFTQPALHSEQR